MTNFVLNGGVRASIEVIEHWSTRPDSYGQGTAAISISRAVTAALWRPGGYTFFPQPGGAAEAVRRAEMGDRNGRWRSRTTV